MNTAVSPKLYELAEDFLEERSEARPRKGDIRDLAETIRQAIELWFCANEESCGIKQKRRQAASGRAGQKLYRQCHCVNELECL